MNDDLDERQPETKAIMSWIKKLRFTASASLHGVIKLSPSMTSISIYVM